MQALLQQILNKYVHKGETRWRTVEQYLHQFRIPNYGLKITFRMRKKIFSSLEKTEPMCLVCLRANVPSRLACYALTCQHVLRVYVLTCQRPVCVLCANVLCVLCRSTCSRIITTNNKNKFSIICFPYIFVIPLCLFPVK